jgi:hypothetical protein
VPVLHRELGGLVEVNLAGALVLAEDPVDGEDVEMEVGLRLDPKRWVTDTACKAGALKGGV